MEGLTGSICFTVSRMPQATFPHMLGKLLPKGNLILGHKHTGGCGRAKFAKKWKHAVGVERRWWKPKERNSITVKEVTAAKHIHIFSLERALWERWRVERNEWRDTQWWRLNQRKGRQRKWEGEQYGKKRWKRRQKYQIKKVNVGVQQSILWEKTGSALLSIISIWYCWQWDNSTEGSQDEWSVN